MSHYPYIIPSIIQECIEDINAYLSSDVPLECYQEDIDKKLSDMRDKVIKTFNNKSYVIILTVVNGGYEKHTTHVIRNVDSQDEAIELAIQGESHDREDNTPPDDYGWYEDVGGEMMYRVYRVTEITDMEADILKKYI